MKNIIKKLIGPTNILLIKSKFKSRQEKELLEKRKTFYKQFLRKEGDLYIDVGANLGNRIQPIEDEGFTIVAVEPQEQCSKYLRRKFGRKIHLVPMGLGQIEEEREMFISESHTISSFSKEWIDSTVSSGRFSDHQWKGRRKVRLTTLDKLISKYGAPSFIKIDVEGFELEVLKGLTKSFGTLSFEYTVPERTELVESCIRQVVKILGSNSVVFNYSIHETMEWALNDWVDMQSILEIVTKSEFIESGFGDVYVKNLHF